ncbi:MAG: M23 family metallopeptidase [Candidatus Niyogibacteria bacterium]|nr:M23 family metallopeptidase [Candidatus Niyogibacteria bacterium]
MVILATFLVYFGLVLPVHAGFFSFFGDLFKSEKTLQPASIINSQTVSLLDAPTNENLLAGTGGGDITIVENSALLPVTGPLGSLADALEVQKKSDQISIYVVREGDTLSGIAKLFGVSVNTIVWANADINRGDLIRKGQVLIILPVSGVQYVVKKGDTLAGIVKKFNGDARDILDFNGLASGSDLAEGMEILIPNGEIAAPKYYTEQYGAPNVQEYAGYYLKPVNGRKTQGIHGYNGVDLAASYGTPIVASATGDVLISKSSGWNGGYGQYIVIQHHLSKNIVWSGWHVVQGQIIGYIGSTGKSTGPHLHFEIRGGPRNPF